MPEPTTNQHRGKPGRPRATHGHGDHRTYQNGCRCDACREAIRVEAAARRARWQADPDAADWNGHGKASTYRNCGCRCDACKAANTADVRARRARRKARAAAAMGGAA